MEGTFRIRFESIFCFSKNDVALLQMHVALLESLEPRHLMASVPFAMDDPIYTTPISTDLVISSTSQGIVNNDFEIDSVALVASVVASPAHGSIVFFNSNGTFTYRPTTGYIGPDIFAYQVSNGSFDSNIETVSLQVGQSFGPRTNLDEIPLVSMKQPA